MDENFFEELLDDEKNYTKERSPFFKWIVGLIIFLLIVFLGYLTYLKLTEKKNEEEDKKEEVVESADKVELDCDNVCEYEVEVKGQKVTIGYAVNTEEETPVHQLKIGDTVIVNRTFSCGGPTTLSVLEDIIFISYHEGCDILGNTIHAYTKDGEEIFNYEYLDSTYNMWMDGTDFDIKGNKLYISATRVYHGPTLRLSANEEVNICEPSEWEIYNIDRNTISSGVYEIEYLGNSNFSTPKLTEKKYVKDLLDLCETED